MLDQDGAADSTTVTKSDPGSQMHEDIFRMIENGKNDALKNLLNQMPRGQLNRSISDTSANGDDKAASSRNSIRCMR